MSPVVPVWNQTERDAYEIIVMSVCVCVCVGDKEREKLTNMLVYLCDTFTRI